MLNQVQQDAVEVISQINFNSISLDDNASLINGLNLKSP